MQNRLKIKLEIVPTPNNLAALSTFFGSLDSDKPFMTSEEIANKMFGPIKTEESSKQLEEAPKNKKPKAEAPVKEEKKEAPQAMAQTVSIESLKEQTNEKAKAGHRDALRRKLDELGATSVSALLAEHYAEYDTFLKSDPVVELEVIEKLLALGLISTEQAMEMTDLTPNGSEGMS